MSAGRYGFGEVAEPGVSEIFVKVMLPLPGGKARQKVWWQSAVGGGGRMLTVKVCGD